MNALAEVTVYVAMTPEMATELATHGSVAPKYNGRWGLRPTREEARRLRAKIEYACCWLVLFHVCWHGSFLLTDRRRSSALWTQTERTTRRTSALWTSNRWSRTQWSLVPLGIWPWWCLVWKCCFEIVATVMCLRCLCLWHVFSSLLFQLTLRPVAAAPTCARNKACCRSSRKAGSVSMACCRRVR